MHSLNGKLAVSECARLVEHYGVDLRQHVHKIGALDEDALARGTAYAAKERERNADDQSTRTRDDEEHQRAIEPSGEGFNK